MIKVSIIYPGGEDVKFDMDYFANKHVPMVGELLGDALKGGQIDEGIAGGEPGSAAPFVAMGHLLFESVESFQAAFGPVAEKIMGDIPNYSNVGPQIQISNVVA